MLGRLIDGRYQVRSRIARGGMATVYLATDLRLERRVAIKVMHGHLADDSTFKSRFVQEARSAARLAHPNVVNVFDQGQDSDMAYLVMEYLPGITLRDLLQDYGKLTPEQTLDIMEAVLSGLAAAHKAGIVHRDLKPENVLLADDGRIKIGDFGLARAVSNNTGTGQALLGTIAYLSPELVTRGVADARSDIYALGIMMYEMLTGQQPFQGEQPMQIAYQHANDTVPAPSSKSPDVPAQLDGLVRWATEREPENRPRDARVMLERLFEVERELGGDGATGIQSTLVLQPADGAALAEPGLTDPGLIDGDTQILGATTMVRAEASATDAVAALAAVGRRRTGRGWWLFALILVLAAVAGGTGWYFGAGPGAQVTVPSLAGKSATAAEALLRDDGFRVATAKVYSSTVAPGNVTASDPRAGTTVHKGSAVTISVSQGRQPVTIKALAGLTLEKAKAAITGAHARVGAVAQQFDATVDKNVVISAAAAAGDKQDLSKGGSYFKGLPVDLLVSLGAVPNVDGKSTAEAQAALDAVGLKGQVGDEKYSDSVADGDVISSAPQKDGPVHLGDTIVLTVSKGPQLFDVPDVVGKNRDQAKKALTDAGFVPTYSAFWDAVPNGLTKVVSMSLDAKTQQPKGTKINLGFSAAG